MIIKERISALNSLLILVTKQESKYSNSDGTLHETKMKCNKLIGISKDFQVNWNNLNNENFRDYLLEKEDIQKTIEDIKKMKESKIHQNAENYFRKYGYSNIISLKNALDGDELKNAIASCPVNAIKVECDCGDECKCGDDCHCTDSCPCKK